MKRILIFVICLISSLVMVSQNDSTTRVYKECGLKLSVGYPIGSYWDGISTSIGFDFLRQIDDKVEIGLSVNLNRLTNTYAFGEWIPALNNYAYGDTSYIGYYGNVYCKINYYFLNLSAKNKRENSLCKMYFTIGSGIGFDDNDYLQQTYGYIFYEGNIGIGVVCHYKKMVLRCEDKYFLPGGVGNGFYLLNGTFKGYYHLFTIGINYKL